MVVYVRLGFKRRHLVMTWLTKLWSRNMTKRKKKMNSWLKRNYEEWG